MTATPTTSSERARAAAGIAPSEESQRQLTPFQQRQGVLERMLPRFIQALQNDEKRANQFMADAITALRTTPGLEQCDEMSLLGSLMVAAQLDLRPNVGALGHCWVLPFKNHRTGKVDAQFILGYQGMVELAARSGVSVTAHTVYERDKFNVRYGLDERLRHEPPTDPGTRLPILDPGMRGNPIAHYVVFRSGRGVSWRVMSHEEALSARDRSPSYLSKRPDAPWRHDHENDWAMCKKTVMRRHFRWQPKQSPMLATALAMDDQVLTYDPTRDVVRAQEDVLALLPTPEERTPEEPEPEPPTVVEPAPRKSRKARPPAGRRDIETAELPPDDEPTPEDIVAMNAEAAAQAADLEPKESGR